MAPSAFPELKIIKTYQNKLQITTLRDSKTDLEWQKNDQQTLTWNEAQSYCKSLELNKKSDWRLPDIHELASLLSFSTKQKSEYRLAFQNERLSHYWTSTLVFQLEKGRKSKLKEDRKYWTLDLKNALINQRLLNQALNSKCVRGKIKNPQREWQSESFGKKNFKEANDFCLQYKTKGSEKWVLPEISDLLSLVEYDNSETRIFNEGRILNFQKSSYWSISPNQLNKSQNRYLSLNTGKFGIINGKAKLHFRCVKQKKKSDIKRYSSLGSRKESTLEISSLDLKTGLEWQTNDYRKLNWEEAVERCDNLVFGNQNDWRLPRLKELLSIVDFKKHYPAVNKVFSQIEPFGYWTSSMTKDEQGAWEVNFRDGLPFSDRLPGVDNLSARISNVMCVRGIAKPPKYQKVSNKIVLDLHNHLVWQRNSTNLDETTLSGEEYCNRLELDNYKNWRLPKITELITLLEQPSTRLLLNNSLFSGSIKRLYLSSSEKIDAKPQKWMINFSKGILETDEYVEPDEISVRCVHSFK